jgi:hypothetical protein
LHHGIKDGEELAHRSDECDFLGLASGAEAIIEDLDVWVVTGSDQSSHVEHSSDLGASAPHRTSASQSATVTVEGSHTYQGGDFFAVECSDLGEACQEGRRHDGPYSRGRAQELFLLSPKWAGLDQLPESTIEVREFVLEPIDMALDTRPDALGGSAQPILLRGQHLNELTPTSQQRGQFLGLLIRKGTKLRSDCLAKPGQYLRVDRVGLGQTPRRSGEVPDLPRIDDHHRKPGAPQGTHDRQLHSTGGFEHHQRRTKLLESLNQFGDARLIVPRPPSFAGWPPSFIQKGLRNVDAHEDPGRSHVCLPGR